MDEIICVIPVRLASSRLPHKPLIDICGKPMIQRTFERARMVFGPKNTFIATDSQEIASIMKEFTQNISITSSECLTGTDRIAEFAEIHSSRTYINLQGDEPIMPIENLQKIKDAALIHPKSIINGFGALKGRAEFESPSVPKVVFNEKFDLLYMSRATIPDSKDKTFKLGYKQICVYSFPKLALQELRSWTTKTQFESIEDIEILRFLEKGFNIKMIELDSNTIAVDTMDDLNRVKTIISTQGDNLDKYVV